MFDSWGAFNLTTGLVYTNKEEGSIGVYVNSHKQKVGFLFWLDSAQKEIGDYEVESKVGCHLNVKNGIVKTNATVRIGFENLIDEKSDGPSEI